MQGAMVPKQGGKGFGRLGGYMAGEGEWYMKSVGEELRSEEMDKCLFVGYKFYETRIRKINI